MIPFIYYAGFHLALHVLIRLPFVGHPIDHGIQHLIEHACHGVERALKVLAAFLWLLLFGLLAFTLLRLWWWLLTDIVTVASLYAYFNRHH